MKTDRDIEQEAGGAKKPYAPPELTVHGSVDKVTGWVGGPWGEFFGGQGGGGWNPWGDPKGS